MRYTVRYLETVRRDREAIKAYLSQYSTTAAMRLFEKIRNKMELVKSNPYMHKSYEGRPQFRRMVIEDYLIFYKVIETSKTIEVHHIFHGTRDIEQHLAKP